MKAFILTERKNIGRSRSESEASGEEVLWIAKDSHSLERSLAQDGDQLFRRQASLRKKVSLCVISETSLSISIAMNALFKTAVFLSAQSALPMDQILDVVRSKQPGRLILGCSVDEATRTVTLIRGDLSSIVVPFQAFRPSGDGKRPNFRKVRVSDHGQTICLGSYEAAADAILYEFDPLFRKARRLEMIEKGKGLGPSLRRLRLQKGLRQTDFPDIDAREVGRIERNEVVPRASTLEKVARALGVKVADIRTY